MCPAFRSISGLQKCPGCPFQWAMGCHAMPGTAVVPASFSALLAASCLSLDVDVALAGMVVELGSGLQVAGCEGSCG